MSESFHTPPSMLPSSWKPTPPNIIFSSTFCRRAWAVDLALADLKFEEICKHYAEPGRFYHTLDHVQNVLEIVESLGSHGRNPNAVKLAGWLHDLIYDSRASDNEERSA